jgi:hypothetical protein
MLRFALPLALLLSACATTPLPNEPPADPQAGFWANLKSLCGGTFSGTMEIGDPVRDAEFAKGPLSMGPVSCLEDEVSIPFKVGADESRTWLFTRTGSGLRLKHVHAKKGVEDAISRYGGDTLVPGTASRQEFPADAFSRALFIRENRPASAQNVWAVEIRPGADYMYEVQRSERHIRVRFALK